MKNAGASGSVNQGLVAAQPWGLEHQRQACAFISHQRSTLAMLKTLVIKGLDELCKLSKALSWVTVHRGVSYRWLFNPSSLITLSLPQESRHG